MQNMSLSVFPCHKRQVHAVAFRQFDIVRSNFVDERRDDGKFARLEVRVTRLDARTAAMIEDLLHRFASSVLGLEYSPLVVRNDKLGSGIVAVDEQRSTSTTLL